MSLLRPFLRGAALRPLLRSYATAPAPPAHLDPEERAIFDILTTKLSPTALEVQDVSGGCGSMYALNVTSEAFRGLTAVKQHRLVNEALGEKVKGWHGVQVRCSVPK